MLPAYTNALILNRGVFVPLFGCAGDEKALATLGLAQEDINSIMGEMIEFVSRAEQEAGKA